MSTCGYPQASWRVNDPTIAGDFDIAYAVYDGLTKANEIEGMNFDLKTDWRGSYTTNLTLEYTHIVRPGGAAIAEADWGSCRGVNRNLYLTVTRVKNSTVKAQPARTERQLQFYPPGTKFADIDITFSNYRGAAVLLKVVSVAVAAGLAALAF